MIGDDVTPVLFCGSSRGCRDKRRRMPMLRIGSFSLWATSTKGALHAPMPRPALQANASFTSPAGGRNAINSPCTTASGVFFVWSTAFRRVETVRLPLGERAAHLAFLTVGSSVSMLLRKPRKCQVGSPNAIHLAWGTEPGTAAPRFREEPFYCVTRPTDAPVPAGTGRWTGTGSAGSPRRPTPAGTAWRRGRSSPGAHPARCR